MIGVGGGRGAGGGRGGCLRDALDALHLGQERLLRRELDAGEE